jgi:hypothetical protein
MSVMTMSVLVANERDESAVRECAIARAKDFARRFAELGSDTRMAEGAQEG